MRETILDSIYSLSFIFTLLAFTNSSLPWNKQVSDLGVKSFGIYLTHYTAQTYVAKAIYWFAPWMLGIQILFQPIIMFVGVAAPLLLMYIVEKSFLRKYYSYLFG
jgi:peptidoglycan/LPS O-acetylase OafA/YrhL